MGRRELLRIDAKVEVEYKNFDQFFREYSSNISKGGMFIKTENVFKAQTVLEISIKLPDLDEPLNLAGEVVHAIEPEMARERGWDPGMGIHFIDFEEGAHQCLEEYVAKSYKVDPRARANDRRAHTRVPVRLRVRFPSAEVLEQDYSEDISRGGIFIQSTKPRQVGDRFIITLVHPDTNEELDLAGEVVRLTGMGAHDKHSPKGMGIKFVDLDAEKKKAVDRFLGMDFPVAE